MTCPQPVNVHVVSHGSGSITFDWDNCGCTSSPIYKVQYVRLSDNYSSSVFSTQNTDYGFSSLQAGNYEFYFWTDCGGGDVSEAIVIEDLVDI